MIEEFNDWFQRAVVDRVRGWYTPGVRKVVNRAWLVVAGMILLVGMPTLGVGYHLGIGLREWFRDCQYAVDVWLAAWRDA